MSRKHTPPAVTDTVQNEIQVMFDRLIVEPVSSHTSEKVDALQNQHADAKKEIIDCVQQKSRQLLGRTSEIDDHLKEGLAANQEEIDKQFKALPELLLKYTQPIYNETKHTYVTLSSQISNSDEQLFGFLKQQSHSICAKEATIYDAITDLSLQLSEATEPIKQKLSNHAGILGELDQKIENIQGAVLKEIQSSAEMSVATCNDVKKTVIDCCTHLSKNIVEQTSEEISSAVQMQKEYIFEDKNRVVNSLADIILGVEQKLDNTLSRILRTKELLLKLLIAFGSLNLVGLIAIIILLLA